MGRGGERWGAGRPGWRVKAEHCLRLDVRELARRKLLGGCTFSWRWTNSATDEEVGVVSVSTYPGQVQLSYAVNGMGKAEQITLVTTECNFGGSRPWFLCPRCSRRVGVLFMRSGRFVCRRCAGVAYASQSEDVMGRAWRRQGKIECRLGPHWARPKAMHRRTHQRLLQSVFDCEEQREDALARFLARFPGLVF